MFSRVMRTLGACLVLASVGFVVACGDGDDGGSTTSTSEAAQTANVDLGAIKTYLTDHTTRLSGDVTTLREDAEAYYDLAKGVDFNYDKLLQDHRSEVADIIKRSQDGFAEANPAYEQMEGVVAGVPSLADYDVIIDAGSDGSDPASAVPFSLETPAGKTYKQPGNFNFLIETSLFGTEPKFAAQGVQPDLDGDGRVEFGEALPDADFYVTAARDFEKNVNELDDAAQAYEPTLQDALTALVVMTPTMSEYFEAWKNSRFVAGNDATEKAFVVASRLNDITDILGGLVLIYDNVKPAVAEADRAQAQQTGQSLGELHNFAADLRDAEAGGKTFTAQDADTLGSEAQDQAEAIAGQVSQAAGRLKITLAD
jgi:hypothetical protein